MKKSILFCLIICFVVNMDVIGQTASDTIVYKSDTTVYESDTITYKSDTTQYREKTRFGVKVGGQISAIDEVHGKSGRRFPGLTLGVVMQMPLQKSDSCRIFFTPELLYSQEGERDNTNDKYKGEDKDVKFYHDYIALPLMFKLYPLKNKLLFVELGPKLSYMINQKNKEKDYPKLNKFDIGLCLGGGVNLGRNDNFELGARLNYGLLDVYPDVDKRNYNIGGAITLTYLFN